MNTVPWDYYEEKEEKEEAPRTGGQGAREGRTGGAMRPDAARAKALLEEAAALLAAQNGQAEEQANGGFAATAANGTSDSNSSVFARAAHPLLWHLHIHLLEAADEQSRCAATVI